MDHPSILYSQLKEHVQKFGYSSLTKDERMFIRKYNDRHSVLGTQKVKTRKTKVRVCMCVCVRGGCRRG